ncbi:MAG TPA: PQQ-binding-like beta-propeller repeat protein [Myxococcaceae bacterium]|nr:PQQ-binding-like beta-propeller repeat protein [Myxococcaceae bacterium]
MSVGRSLAAASLLAVAGCASHGYVVDPYQHTDTDVLSIFTVKWWQKLVDAPTLEYGPREPARPGFDPMNLRVVTGTRDGILRSIDSRGKTVWRFVAGQPFNAGPVVVDGFVFAPGGDGFLYCFRADTGELFWKYEAGEDLVTVPVVADGKVLVASQNDTLYAVETATGKWLWQYRRDAPAGFTVRGASRPAVRNGIVYVGFSDGHLAAMHLDTGVAVWDRVLSNGTQFIDVDSPVVFDPRGNVIVAAYKDGVFSVDAASGDTLWRTTITGMVGLVARGEVVFASGDGQVTAMLATTGKVIWSTSLGQSAGLQPALAGGWLMVPTGQALLFLDPANGAIRHRFDPGRGVTATPDVRGPKVFVLSNLGFVYELEMNTYRGRG